MRFQLVTDRSPTEAFEAVADFGRIAEWDPFVAASELVSGEPMRVGSRYRLTAPGGLNLEYQIEHLSPPERVEYRGGTRRVSTTDSISVRPDGAGAIVVIESKVRFSGWTRLISPFVLFGIWAGGRFVSLPAMAQQLSR
jgi:hypothetical protein